MREDRGADGQSDTAGLDRNGGACAAPRDPWAFRRWAFEQSTGNVGRKAVLAALASMADSESGRCEAKHDTIARWVEVSRRSVIRHIEALREAGLIATRRQFRRDGSRRGDEYLLLAPWVTEWPDGDPIQSATVSQRSQSANGDTSKVPTATSGVSRLSQQERPLGNDHSGTKASSSADGVSAWEALPDEMRQDAAALLGAKRKVDSRVVTEREMQVAAAALAEFNRQAESDFGLGANLTSVVMRVRERPSWDAAKHQRLVQSAWRLKWWERNGGRRRPTPSVIYGNVRVFEQVAQDAAEEATGRLDVRPDAGLRTKVWPDGRRWDELTPNEQSVAREAVTMGLRPWEAEERPVAAASGNGHAVTADTWLRDD